MIIGVDAMGGDFAPKNEVLGAIKAFPRLKAGSRIALFGDKNQIEAIAKAEGFDVSNFDAIHTTEVIGMNDLPAKAFVQKPDSSISVGFTALAEGKINGFASAGNTGAMMAAAMYSVKVIDGIIRPCISTDLPLMNGKTALLLDVGFNSDCKPEMLYQYALLGSIYASEVMDINNPRVALLNIGEEEEKGDLLTKAAYELMKGTSDFNFVGNVEGHAILSGKVADVVVCDGFVGNVVLKLAEGFYRVALKQGIDNEYFNRFNYEIYGGTPALGVNAPVIIGHGASSPRAIMNMILQTEHVIKAELVKKVKEALNK
ncbi:MAG: phosphate acyltransferase PlsX [Prevotellaceae bacterium]|jgi:glycerol-3-phosphate acyltransferase PlsX|nr:phosphate acyltransferase PlsX [Prevotellaceae bacterium]